MIIISHSIFSLLESWSTKQEGTTSEHGLYGKLSFPFCYFDLFAIDAITHGVCGFARAMGYGIKPLLMCLQRAVTAAQWALLVGVSGVEMMCQRCVLASWHVILGGQYKYW